MTWLSLHEKHFKFCCHASVDWISQVATPENKVYNTHTHTHTHKHTNTHTHSVNMQRCFCCSDIGDSGDSIPGPDAASEPPSTSEQPAAIQPILRSTRLISITARSALSFHRRGHGELKRPTCNTLSDSSHSLKPFRWKYQKNWSKSDPALIWIVRPNG